MREPEPQLVERARRGDAGAFEALVRASQGDMYRLALRLVRDPSLAEDVTQEAFLKAYRSLRRFRGTASFSTWMYRITRNCAVDAVRRAARQRRLAGQAEEPAPLPDASLRSALGAAVDALPAGLREPFVLIEVFGMSYTEASVVLGVPAGTLKSRMHRARQQLMTELAEEDAGEV
ncbi:MAG TPA: sigma-70 family RNA polymerase sigma factor [Actinomycetota bacterium]